MYTIDFLGVFSVKSLEGKKRIYNLNMVSFKWRYLDKHIEKFDKNYVNLLQILIVRYIEVKSLLMYFRTNVNLCRVTHPWYSSCTLTMLKTRLLLGNQTTDIYIFQYFAHCNILHHFYTVISENITKINYKSKRIIIVIERICKFYY